ncbi:response regulator [Kumtagia ephedrae]|jgi:two-component system chemotaxis response regulator CheY|uniref:Response regulator n=1 Tax=Kumtagia ephedrae TaxID=2116701 RepID=A0A2P7RPG9_9HYPH|nr:response regulator [Mesorhizobium ephedrae]PSJ52104.1 response regulator [Mesorhizobium ephedrae]
MKRCMFVDDSSVIRKVAKRILNGPDLMLVEAASGLDAIEMCEADMPDIVVVDSALPDLPTIEVIRRIRAIPSAIVPHIAICLTEMDVAAIMRAKRAGAQSYILKPFNRAQLLERFRAMGEAKSAASAA